MGTKKQTETLISQACTTVPGFATTWKELERKIVLDGNSNSTLTAYGRSIAQVALHFNKDPLLLKDEQVNEYLYQLNRNGKNSESYYKFAVYGLRYLYRVFGREDKAISLPPLRKKSTLPTVLSKEECRKLFSAPRLLKHRVLLAFIYSAGLRMNEARTLRIEDIDSDRMQIHVRQGKGRKDRYVVLSNYILQGLRKYHISYQPKIYLFNGTKPGEPLGKRSLQWIVSEAAKKTSIRKEVNVHTLRHSFATHLLEDGVDLYTIKEQLGHERIETTLTYLHIAKTTRQLAHSPLDTLYGKK